MLLKNFYPVNYGPGRQIPAKASALKFEARKVSISCLANLPVGKHYNKYYILSLLLGGTFSLALSITQGYCHGEWGVPKPAKCARR